MERNILIFSSHASQNVQERLVLGANNPYALKRAHVVHPTLIDVTQIYRRESIPLELEATTKESVIVSIVDEVKRTIVSAC